MQIDKSGQLGAALWTADIAEVLWNGFIKHNPTESDYRLNFLELNRIVK